MSASCSMFSQILKLIPRTDFERMIKQTKAEHRAKGLSRWSHFVAMLFCQLGRAEFIYPAAWGKRPCLGGSKPANCPAPS